MSSAAEERLPAALQWGAFRCLATDPIGMEFWLEVVDPELRSQFVTNYLETVAAVHSALAEGAAKAARINAGGK
jgi:hypothetical protein